MLKRWLVSALGVWIGSYFLEGIDYEDSATLVLVAILLGLFTAVLKPLLVLLALPFVLVTLGLGVLFINALLYLLVGELVPGFEVDGFGPAFLGALIITGLNLVFGAWLNGGRGVTVKASRGGSSLPRRGRRAADDVIDI